MSILDYSEKSFVVVGAPSHLWESLAELGGLFNTKLKNIDDGKGRGWGWVFSNKKLDTVTTFLGLRQHQQPTQPHATAATTATKAPMKPKSPAVTTTATTSDFPVPDKTRRKYISLLGYGTAYKEMTETFGNDPTELQSTTTIMITLDRFNKQIYENAKTFKEWTDEDGNSK